MRFQGFIGPTYEQRSVNVDAQKCVNMYPELNELGMGKAGERFALVGTPGLELLVTIGDGPIRGMHVGSNGTLYVVSDNKVYSVSSAWVATELGTLDTTSGNVSFADNGTQACFVDGTSGYIITLSSGAFAKITDPDFQPADQVTFQDGYFIFNRTGTQQFFISAINDGTSFDALEIASAEGNPDNIVAILSNNRDLWLFGGNSTEVWFNSGNADFPFERIQGAFVEHGCEAPWSVQKMENTLFWLGKDEQGGGVVYMASGYQPQRISTHPVEVALRTYGDLSNGRAWTYQQDGHNFYCLNFDGASTTWVFDASTNMWHERQYLNNGDLERHRADTHGYVYSTHVVGDYQNGRLYRLSDTVYTDNTVAIVRRRRSPHISTQSLDRVFYNEFQLDIEAGVGLATGQGSDPQAMLRFSDDGGNTWSNEKWTSFGVIGATKKRALWRRLGASRDRIFEISISDPVPVILIGAELGIEQGAS
jgi:hypothetical protein